jgi:Leucine-rich repeat (LRR) protein
VPKCEKLERAVLLLLQECASLTSLTRLVLDNNHLRLLPEVVVKLSSLAVLQASGNGITYLPDILEQMHSLQALMVSENQVRAGNSLQWTLRRDGLA